MIALVPAVRRFVLAAAVAGLAGAAAHGVRSTGPRAERSRAAASRTPQLRGIERVEETYRPVPPAIVVLDAGAAPRAPIRYRGELGARTRFELVVHHRGGPDLVVLGATEIARVHGDGAIRIHNQVDRVAPARAGDRLDLDRLDLDGLVVDTMIEATGAIRWVEIRARRPAQRSVIERVAFALSSIEQFPQDPVGLGARWQTTGFVPGGQAAPVARTRITTLISVQGAVAELRSTTTDSAADQVGTEDGRDLHLLALEARGDGQRVVALDTLAGAEAAWQRGTRTATLGGDDRTEPVEARVDLVRRRWPLGAKS